MPQFDTFIFSSSLFYFICSFFLVLYGNQVRFLPSLGGIIKLRKKISFRDVNSKIKEISSFKNGFSYTK